MSFEIFIQLTISGLTTGAVYSLIALGFTTIYRSSNILNLAQGEFVMLGGLFTVFFLKKLGLSYAVAGISAVISVTVIGMLIQRVVIHPIRDEGLLILIMVTIGLSVFLSGTSALVFGPSPQSLPPILDREPLLAGDAIRINVQNI